MTDNWSRGIARAEEEVGVARELLASGHFNQACSRGYFAAFYPASAALSLLGERRTKHSGVVAAFNEKVAQSAGFPVAAARDLNWLFTARNTADYWWERLQRADAEEAVERAARFVDAVREWIRRRQE